jgi:hypothetical protein
VQWAAHPPPGTLLVQTVGFLDGVGIHRNSGVESILIHRDAREILHHQLMRCDPALLHGSSHIWNRGFDDGE